MSAARPARQAIAVTRINLRDVLIYVMGPPRPDGSKEIVGDSLVTFLDQDKQIGGDTLHVRTEHIQVHKMFEAICATAERLKGDRLGYSLVCSVLEDGPDSAPMLGCEERLFGGPGDISVLLVKLSVPRQLSFKGIGVVPTMVFYYVEDAPVVRHEAPASDMDLGSPPNDDTHMRDTSTDDATLSKPQDATVAPATPAAATPPAEDIDVHATQPEGTEATPFVIDSDDEGEGDTRHLQPAIPDDPLLRFSDADEADVTTGVISMIRPNLDQGTFQEVCKFYDYTPGGQDKVLLGTKQALSDIQLWVNWKCVVAFFVGKEIGGRSYPCRGHINSLTTGLGKTRASLGLVQTLYLLDISRFLINLSRTRNDGEHNPTNCPRPCPSKNPLGIQCPCDSSSLGALIISYHGMDGRRGPALMMCPPGAIKGAYNMAAAYFTSDFVASGFVWPGITPYVEYGNQGVPRHVISNILAREDKRLAVTELPPKNKWSNPPDFELGPYALEYNGPEEEENHPVRPYFIIASSNPGSLKGLGHRFGRTYKFKVKNLVNPHPVVVPWHVKFSVVFLDEYHETKGEATKVMNLFRDLLAHTPLGCLKIMLLSATPMITSLERSLKGPAEIICDPSWNDTDHPMRKYSAQEMCKTLAPFVDKLARVEPAQMKELLSQGELELDVSNWVNFHISMVESTDYINGKRVVKLTPLHILQIPCGSELPRNYKEWLQPFRADWSKEKEKLTARIHAEELAKGSNADMIKRRIDNEITRLQKFSTDYHKILYASSMPGLARFPHTFASENLQSATIGRIDTPEARKTSTIFSHIEALTNGCGKIKALEKIARICLAERATPHGKGQQAPMYKANLAIFCQHPGSSAIVACYCDWKLSDRFKVLGINRKTMPKDRLSFLHDNINAKIPVTSDEKPTILVANTGVVGTALDGFQKFFHHLIIFEPSFTGPKQPIGRVYRFPQEYEVYVYLLFSTDTENEEAIIKLSNARAQSFNAARGKGIEQTKYGGSFKKLPDSWIHQP
jgi:hypothetical protein